MRSKITCFMFKLNRSIPSKAKPRSCSLPPFLVEACKLARNYALDPIPRLALQVIGWALTSGVPSSPILGSAGSPAHDGTTTPWSPAARTTTDGARIAHLAIWQMGNADMDMHNVGLFTAMYYTCRESAGRNVFFVLSHHHVAAS